MCFRKLIGAWICLSALATAAGWVLSALGQLNRIGYIVFFGVAGLVWFLIRKNGGRMQAARQHFGAGVFFRKWKRRFRRPFPFIFAVIAFLAFLGGALYPPSNHTALTYRTARVLHWLAEGRWHWIHSPNWRLNDRACGIEWLSTPLLLFTRSDRGIFLLNIIPFLLMPGLLFGLWTQLGVRGKVAWHWMWVLPTGYCFLLQAGSAGNDAFPTVYALAAMDFGCRCWKSFRVKDLWLSILGAALLVGAKASNLPLLLPWALLVFPLVPVLWGGRPFQIPFAFMTAGSAETAPGGRTIRIGLFSLGVCVLALLVSFLPTAVLNTIYCHTWSGLQLERPGMDMKNPIVGIWGNAFLFLLDNFVPPVFPLASWWNQNALTLIPQFIVRPLMANFEQSFELLGELPTEDWSGLGCGVSVLWAVSVVAALALARRALMRKPRQGSGIPELCRFGALIGPWIALLAYCMKSGMVSGARLIAPYYPFLLSGFLLLTGQIYLVRRRWWRVFALCVMLVALGLLVVTPGRPLWPANTITGKLAAAHPQSHLLARAVKVYSVYAERSDPSASIRQLLPAGLQRVGFLGNPDDIDISLWRPFGSRRVLHVLLDDSAEQIRQRHIEYIVVGGFNLSENHVTLQQWLDRTGATLVATTTATLRVAEGKQEWYVTRLAP